MDNFKIIKHLLNGLSVATIVASNRINMLTKHLRMNPRRKWTMMSKTGKNSKEKAREKTILKGRGKRVHKGGYPTRGKGRTTQSFR